MSKHFFKRRIKFFALGAAVIALLFTSILFLYDRDNKQFDTLTRKIFTEELNNNTLNLHYTIAYPENYGLEAYNAVLPCYSAAEHKEGQKEIEGYIAKLDKLSLDKLTPENKFTYALLSSFLSDAIKGSTFTYYDEPLSPSSGMQSQLPILLAEYTFRTERDVLDYLALLDQTDEYFTSLAVYEQEKKQAGLLQADTSLQKVREQCDTILSRQELENGTHFLQSTFKERLIPLIENGTLSEKTAEYYSSDNDRLLTTVMQPAYEKLSDDLFLLMGDGTSPTGLASLQGGREYYAHLVHTTTGSSLNVAEIKKLLYPQFESEYRTLQNLLTSFGNSSQALGDCLDGTLFPFTEPADMILDLQERMAAAFPPFSSPSESYMPVLAIKAVSENLQDYSAPAFYLTPPLDDTNSNVIYINQKSTPAGLDLYTTLAHEGYPGHLYQSVYSQMKMLSDGVNPVRQILWYGGYLEGWALYVEFISYDYASQLMTEKGMDNVALAYEIEKHNRNMQLCLYSLLDIAIHYDGASYEQVHDVLTSFGVSNANVTRAVYNYISEEPATYLKYYLGYMEILRLQDKARTLWGDSYTDYKFHQFFLECGPADFASLEQALTASSDLP